MHQLFTEFIRLVKQQVYLRYTIPFRFYAMNPQCLKITEKVSFNIASEASYVYILSGQNLILNAKKSQFWRFFENLKLVVKQCYLKTASLHLHLHYLNFKVQR